MKVIEGESEAAEKAEQLKKLFALLREMVVAEDAPPFARALAAATREKWAGQLTELISRHLALVADPHRGFPSSWLSELERLIVLLEKVTDAPPIARALDRANEERVRALAAQLGIRMPVTPEAPGA